jgi:superfamily I DNA/RNA helicase
MALPDSLTHDDGSPFSGEELKAISVALEALDQKQREDYGNRNSEAIANNRSKRMLIISGPGTGKSHLFLKRIEIWLNAHKLKEIFVTSFVRKLVTDLQAEVRSKVSERDQGRIDIWTLHRLAKSIVERNHGNSERRFQQFLKIVGPSWKQLVWSDVLGFHPELRCTEYPWEDAEKQFHEDSYRLDGAWPVLLATYITLTAFFNAANFCDLIVAARIAVQENPDLATDGFFIIDEYQDFNRAEGHLLESLTQRAEGVLIVGDDDQVLYDTLKAGNADLIRTLYSNSSIANAILPFCRRCAFHITKAAAAFIGHDRDPNAINKVFLTKDKLASGELVHIVGCSAPATAVDYVRKFVEEHRADIEQRKTDLASGLKTEAYLLILTPAKELNFFRSTREELISLVGEFKRENQVFSEDYFRVLTYYSLAKDPSDNFAFRKVLEYERANVDEVHEYLARALSESKALVDLDSDLLSWIMEKSRGVEEILNATTETEEKVEDIVAAGVEVLDRSLLAKDLKAHEDARRGAEGLQQHEEQRAEAAEMDTQEMSAVELLSIVSAKGLSADHVIIVGFDNVNMRYVTRNAFFVALTRARQTLHLLTALKSGGATTSHQFVHALPEGNVKFEWYNKGNRQSKPFANRREFLSYVDYMRKKVSGTS